MSDWSKEERELDDLLRDTRDTIAVFLGETYHPGAQIMATRLRSIEYKWKDLRVIELAFSTYRHWASLYEVEGTPAILLFRDGAMLLKLRGVFEEERLEELLREAL